MEKKDSPLTIHVTRDLNWGSLMVEAAMSPDNMFTRYTLIEHTPSVSIEVRVGRKDGQDDPT